MPTARAARRSVVWSIGLIGGFYLMTIVLGFGAAALVGSAEVRASNAAGNTAVPLLALHLGGGEGSTGGTILFAVAASANLPALLYSLFWRGFTTRGAVWAVYGGLIPAVVLVLVSPVVSGPRSLFPGVDFPLFPLENPGLVSIPLGFLAGWIGTVTSSEQPDEAKHAEAEVRALTGVGAA